ncbi:Tetratricopeptide TPR_2 repeat protein [Candidatus Sulfopaludibacter sp. SbA3]|nr:Tetratricopeptide TPR_2 repeat protein [Candidatus Sulfopaludibacter sp. SbA3]
MFRRVFVFAALLATAITLAPERSDAASKEIQELQRDIAQLQEQMKQLQQAQDKNFATLTVLSQQALDAANRANTAVAVIQSSIQQSLKDQQEKVVAPVVGLSTRMDSMSNDFRQVTQAVADLTSMVSQLKSQLGDINQAIKVLSTPPPPPPGTTTTAPQATAEVPTMSAGDLANAAEHDRQGGNFVLALQEFANYLKFYGNTEYAPIAQYYIAQMHMSSNDFDTAANEFDLVLEKYPENSKTKDARFYKGVCLVKSGKRQAGADEFRKLIADYPRTDQADKACTQLTSLGLHCPSATPSKSGGKKKKG